MLWERSQSDMRRMAAFVKRLSTLALHLSSVDATIAVLATVQQLLVRYKKCRVMLENVPSTSPLSTSPAIIDLWRSGPGSQRCSVNILVGTDSPAQHPKREVAKHASTIAGISRSKSAAMPIVTPMATGKGSSPFYSVFSEAAHAPFKFKPPRRRTRGQRQVASPFLESLEEKSGLPASLDDPYISMEDIKRIRKLLGAQFRLIEACAGDHATQTPQKSRNKVASKSRSPS